MQTLHSGTTKQDHPAANIWRKHSISYMQDASENISFPNKTKIKRNLG